MLKKLNREKNKQLKRKKTKKISQSPKKLRKKKLKFNKLKLNKNVKTMTIIMNMITKNSIWLLSKQVISFHNIEYSITSPLKNGFARPVIVHRAIFGSL